MSKEKHIHKIVAMEEYAGIPYWIVENGLYTEDGEHDYRWYCAYVRPPKDKKKKLKTEELEVHGGITFEGKLSLMNLYVWGWDYNHCYDVDYENGLKSKFQSKPIEEVVDIIATDCQEFIRRYLI